MTQWHDITNGASKIAAGLRQMGVDGAVHVALEPDDGERLEQLYSKQGRFADLQVPSGRVYRTVDLGGVHFRWPKR